ncbi:MAG: hypothetical protein KVP17_005180 [Porospora cf. gigantea B]|uniref:uncharacterized protein n=1 Tax=Porospora cf. gigantea B TaxID=2853592 RepID=UPI0035717E54|nr:MAG: hypothetical protein KVP17_005180 [Porospora cf. gigantea B]
MSRDLRPLNVSADQMERGEARRHSHPGVLGPDFTSPFSSNTINDALRDIKRGMSFTGAVVSSGLRLPEIAGLPLTTTSREPMLTFDDRLEETTVLESLEADILRDESHCQGPYENSGGDAQVDCLTILTFNAGLLDYRVCGISVYTNPAFASRRLGHMPISLRSSEADIVALQEVYEHSHADSIIESLRLIYPFHARRASGGCLSMHNGLLVLSKFPITTSKFHKFTSATIIESIFASKGILETTIVVPGVGHVCLLNVHLASGAVNPESEQMENLRNKQLAQVLDIVRSVARRNECPVLMGDLNAAPDLCGSTYNLLESQGWEDLFYRAQISTLCKSLGEVAALTQAMTSPLFTPGLRRIRSTQQVLTPIVKVHAATTSSCRQRNCVGDWRHSTVRQLASCFKRHVWLSMAVVLASGTLQDLLHSQITTVYV